MQVGRRNQLGLKAETAEEDGRTTRAKANAKSKAKAKAKAKGGTSGKCSGTNTKERKVKGQVSEGGSDEDDEEEREEAAEGQEAEPAEAADNDKPAEELPDEPAEEVAEEVGDEMEDVEEGEGSEDEKVANPPKAANGSDEKLKTARRVGSECRRLPRDLSRSLTNSPAQDLIVSL